MSSIRSRFSIGFFELLRYPFVRQFSSQRVNTLMTLALSLCTRSGPEGMDLRSSSAERSSMRLFVVLRAAADPSLPSPVTQAQPPGPGFPMQEPSTAAIVVIIFQAKPARFGSYPASSTRERMTHPAITSWVHTTRRSLAAT